MDYLVEHPSDAQKLDLADVRVQLIRLEDTIIFHLIERVQFPYNGAIYRKGGVHIEGSDLSMLDSYLLQTEKLQAQLRRYQSPDEYPFFPDAVKDIKPILKPLDYPKVLYPNDVNVNDKLKQSYIDTILPKACAHGGDRGESKENYGSAATVDVLCLQALSRRIHYGKFVAEVKFQQETAAITELIRNRDRDGINRIITDEAVERQVLERLRNKALSYGRDPTKPDAPSRINADAVVEMYRDYVIPLTKEVEVEYLIQRLIRPEEGNSIQDESP